MRYPNRVTPDAQDCYDKAEALYLAGRFPEADMALERFIEGFPYNELTDESRFLRGEIAFAQNDFTRAIEFYRQSVGFIASPFVAPKAHFKAAMSMSRLHRYEDALAEIGLISRRDASAILRLRIDSLGVRASKEAGLPAKASIVWRLRLLDDYADLGPQASSAGADEVVAEGEAAGDVKGWIDDQAVEVADIEALPFEQMKGRRSGGYASYKLASALHRSGRTDEAARALKSYIRSYPTHEYYSAARLLMAELGGVIGDAAGVAIGAVLPLSGRLSVYGESVLHGIECAVGVYEPCTGPGGMRIIVRDSRSNANGAAAAVDELYDEGVVAIIGPLVSADVQSAASMAQRLEVPLISLSQRSGVVEIGDYIFRNSISPNAEVLALVEYVMGRRRLKRFFVLYPDNRKGEEYKNLFADAVDARGGKIVSSQPYAPNQLEFARELRGEQGSGGAFALSSEGGRYDAIFIPDSFWVVSYLAPTMALMGIDKVQLLGISRWNDPKLVERGGEFVEGSIFVDSFFKQAPEEQVASFVSRFKSAYGVEPTLLEALGYDTSRMIIAAVLEGGAMSRQAVRDALHRMSSFPGVAGVTQFDGQGEAKRRLWVLTVKDGVIRLAE